MCIQLGTGGTRTGQEGEVENYQEGLLSHYIMISSLQLHALSIIVKLVVMVLYMYVQWATKLLQ
jgi:hypothetical protein